MIITAFFTNLGIPAESLSPTIRIRDLSDNSLVITDAAMSEVASGGYKYDFTAYDTSKNYFIVSDGTSALPNSERYVYGGNEVYSDDIADGVWDEKLRDHQSAKTTGYRLKHITGGGVKKVIQKGVWSEEEKIKMIDAMKEFETMLLRINEQSKVQIDEESVNEMTSQLSTKLESLNINDESILSLSENVKEALSIKDTAIDALNEKIEEIRGYNTKLIKMNDVAIEDIAVLAKLVAKTIPEDKLEECLNEIKDDSE